MKRYMTIAFVGCVLAMHLASAADPVVKVSALASGEVLLNGKPVSIEQVEANFKELSNKQGAVWYYRENPESEPPPQAMELIRLVVKYQLPISMSSKRDFSDYVDQYGNSRPRQP